VVLGSCSITMVRIGYKKLCYVSLESLRSVMQVSMQVPAEYMNAEYMNGVTRCGVAIKRFFPIF
jgi:hypothetical protein